MEQNHLDQYNRVCGNEKESNVLAPCYPVMSVFLFQPYIVSLPSFPVSPLGIVHIRTIVAQHKPIAAGTNLKFDVSMKGHRDTERGLEIDFIIKASTASGEVVWTCLETMLSRKVSGGSKKGPSSEEPKQNWDGEAHLKVSESTGRKYAAVTGDYNPHHLTAITSKLVGFPRPIAHGQWSLERCLSELSSNGLQCRPPFKIDCSFKLPVFMPGKVLVRWITSGAPNHNKVQFEMRSDDGKLLPHVVGRIENLEKPANLE